jgi:hypothetical protein
VETTNNITLICESPAEVSGKSWEILEDKCKPTTTTTESTIPATNATSRSALGTTINKLFTKDVSAERGSQEVEPPNFRAIFIAVFAIAVCIAIAAVIIWIRRVRKPNLNHLWWEDQVTRKDMMSE